MINQFGIQQWGVHGTNEELMPWTIIAKLVKLGVDVGENVDYNLRYYVEMYMSHIAIIKL
jgi:hypothetical protein